MSDGATRGKTKKKSRGKKKKRGTRRYGRAASKKVGKALHEAKRGKLSSGRSKKKVKSREQAIAIGLAEARRSGAKVPLKRGKSKKRGTKKR
jgi:hypothetical protein